MLTHVHRHQQHHRCTCVGTGAPTIVTNESVNNVGTTATEVSISIIIVWYCTICRHNCTMQRCYHLAVHFINYRLACSIDTRLLLTALATAAERVHYHPVNALPLHSFLFNLPPPFFFHSRQPHDYTMHRTSRIAQAWRCTPEENRVLLFDGSLLHGVVPSAPASAATNDNGEKDDSGAGAADSDPARITLMLGWWASATPPILSPPPDDDGLNVGPNMPMPTYQPPSPRPSSSSSGSSAASANSASTKRKGHAAAAATDNDTSGGGGGAPPEWIADMAAPVLSSAAASASANGTSSGGGNTVPAELEHCANVWCAVKGSDCSDPVEGSAGTWRCV